MEGDHLSLDFTVDGIDLVTDEDDRDVVADANDIAVPVGYVLVGVTASDVEHDDGAVALDVVTVTEATELLLTSGIPAVEGDLATVGLEGEGVDVDTDGGDVALLELASQVALNEGGLACTAITDENQLEDGDAACKGLLGVSTALLLWVGGVLHLFPRVCAKGFL